MADDARPTAGPDYLGEIRGETASAIRAVVGKVVADSASLEQAHAGTVICEQAVLRQSSALSIEADSAELDQCAVGVARAAQMQMEESTAGAIVAGEVSAPEIRCVLLNAERVEGNVNCILSDWWVAALGGLALGAGFALAGVLLRRRKQG